jgi:hypothetical protein
MLPSYNLPTYLHFANTVNVIEGVEEAFHPERRYSAAPYTARTHGMIVAFPEHPWADNVPRRSDAFKGQRCALPSSSRASDQDNRRWLMPVLKGRAVD